MSGTSNQQNGKRQKVSAARNGDSRPAWVTRLLNISLAVLSLAITLAAVEVFFRVQENQGRSHPDYEDAFNDALGPGGMLLPGYEVFMRGGYGEPVRWKINALGFRNDYDVAPGPHPGVLRLLSMGDSFAAGYRLNQEETYSWLLEQMLGNAFGPAQVLVGHVGSPTKGMYYLEKYGADFHPQVVLLGLTLGNDIAEVYADLDHGGRFRIETQGDDHRVVLQDNPSIDYPWEYQNLLLPEHSLKPRGPLSGFFNWLDWLRIWRRISALFSVPNAIKSFYKDGLPRLFDPANGLGFYLEPPPREIEEAFQRLFTLLEAYDQFSRKRGIIFVLGVWPQRYQVQPKDWELSVIQYGLRPEAFDLEAPNRRIMEFCRDKGILCLDPTAALRQHHLQTGTGLYLPLGDMHWNSEGNRVVAEVLFQGLHDLVQELDPWSHGGAAPP